MGATTTDMAEGLGQLWLRAGSGTLAPLPGRDCGGCTACCVAPSIDAPQMQKLAGAVCRHCVGGCAIHAARPQICRDFFCAWRQLPFLDEDWRPDRSGVMMKLTVTDGVTGLSLLLRDEPERTVRRPWFIAFIVTALQAGVPLWLALDGPVGHDGAQFLLNSPEMDAAMASSKGAQARVKTLLETALAKLRDFVFVPNVFRYSGNDVSLP